jgi:hypothetical protein
MSHTPCSFQWFFGSVYQLDTSQVLGTDHRKSCASSSKGKRIATVNRTLIDRGFLPWVYGPTANLKNGFAVATAGGRWRA